MRVFLSWSGDRSLRVAESFRDWLPNVIQSVEPWLSLDIEKGSVWGFKLATELKLTRVGIICLTPENITSPWLLFEAGAISTALEQSYVCPFLFNLLPSGVIGPLSQFQITTFEKDDMQRLLVTINQASGDASLPESKLLVAFEKWWPDFEQSINGIPQPVKKMATYVSDRSDRDVLEEILKRSLLLERLMEGSLFGLKMVIEDMERGAVPSMSDLAKVVAGLSVDDALTLRSEIEKIFSRT